jgi:hypothetical protein
VLPQTTFEPRYECLPEGGGLPSHKAIPKDLPAVLDVVAVISNPIRYRSRYDLYRSFERSMTAAGVRLTTVEMAYGERLFEITTSGNPRHVQVRTSSDVWAKEALINIGISRLPSDFRYVAWVDADVQFADPAWAQNTLQALQHYAVVQPWSIAHDLGPNHEVMNTARSFMSCYREQVGLNLAVEPGYAKRYGYWHSGFSWAARREAIDAVGGLLDFAPLGSADFYMAWAMIGELGGHLYQDVADARRRKRGFNAEYIKALMDWQDRAKALRKNVGFVPGTILHYFHGSKKKRAYNSRENILIDNDFRPSDLKRDWQGIYQLHDHGDDRYVKLRDQIRDYMMSRDEDGTEA